VTQQTPTTQLETATLLRALLEAIKNGELEANTPQALGLVDQLEGAVNAQLGRPGLIPEASIDRILELRRDGISYRVIADQLNDEQVASGRGGRWYGPNVYRALQARGLLDDVSARSS
jgi:hypothetical protein